MNNKQLYCMKCRNRFYGTIYLLGENVLLETPNPNFSILYYRSEIGSVQTAIARFGIKAEAVPIEEAKRVFAESIQPKRKKQLINQQ